MADIASFQRAAGWAGLAAAALAVASIVLGGLALGFDPLAFSDPLGMLALEPRKAELLRWSMLCDMLGYYLLLWPLALLAWAWLRQVRPLWSLLLSVCGLAYALVGAIGAVVLAAVLPGLSAAYAAQPEPAGLAVELVGASLVNAVYLGLWNTLEMILGGAWWLGLGLLLGLARPALPALRWLSLLLGAAALFVALSRMLGLEPLFALALPVVLALIPVWTLWFAVEALRRG